MLAWSPVARDHRGALAPLARARRRCAATRPAAPIAIAFADASHRRVRPAGRRATRSSTSSRGGRATLLPRRDRRCSTSLKPRYTPRQSLSNTNELHWERFERRMGAAVSMFHHNFPSYAVGQPQAGRRLLRARARCARRRAPRTRCSSTTTRSTSRLPHGRHHARRVAGFEGVAPRWPSSGSSPGPRHEPAPHARGARRRGKPLRVALIGAGKFGSMYLAQAKHTPGIHVVGDRRPRARARARVARAHRLGPRSASPRARSPRRRSPAAHCITDDARALIAAPEIEIVIDATGNPPAGIRHALACCAHGKHVVMVNVEADALAGPAARAARARGGHRLFARVRRPAGADLRDGRLVPRRGLRGRRRRQGHEVPARVPRVDARHGVAALRLHAGAGRRRRLQRADVQLVPRRHQERDRDGGGRQRDRACARAGRARVPALRRRRPAARAAAARRGRAAAPRRAGRGDLERSSATAGRCSATCAGAST